MISAVSPNYRGMEGIFINGGTHEQSWTEIQLEDFQSLKLAIHLTLNRIVATRLHVCGGLRAIHDRKCVS